MLWHIRTMYFGDEKRPFGMLVCASGMASVYTSLGVCLIRTASVGEGLNTQLFDLFVACLIEVCVLL